LAACRWPGPYLETETDRTILDLEAAEWWLVSRASASIACGWLATVYTELEDRS